MKRKRGRPPKSKAPQATLNPPKERGLFTPLVRRRINRLDKRRKRFFFTLLKERLPLAERFEDTTVDQIVHDCLGYAEAEGLDVKRELAELRAPIPHESHEESSTGWAMKYIWE